MANAIVGDASAHGPIEDGRQASLQPMSEPIAKVSRSCPSIVDNSITQLWTPADSSKIVADLCFVHGLGGHPKGTWSYGKTGTVYPLGSTAPENDLKGRSRVSSLLERCGLKKGRNGKQDTVTPQAPAATDGNGTSCFWPFDLVPEDFDSVRILTYGYDSHPSHFYKSSTNQMTITQHAQQLLQQITNARTECRRRPIIFIAHSLGGILVKDMIIQSGKYEYQPNLLDVSKSTFAIVFFGTPHLGANVARYGEMVSNVVGSLPGGPSVYKDVLRGLKPDGEKLSNVNADFNDVLNRNVPAPEKIQIYSFQEGKPISSIKLFDGKVVPDTSSFFNRRDIEQVSFIAENHVNMCRFKSAGAAGYMDFKAVLRGYLDKISAKAEQNKCRNQTESGQLWVAERQALRQCLDFEERLVRQQQIESLATIEETFEWLWYSPFFTWLQSSSPLFWISGNPASGKSTLMSHIAQNSKTLSILRQAHDSDWQLVYHFFDFRAGNSIGNNFEGLLRSFLLQLLQACPNLLSQAPELKPFLLKDFAIPRPSINAMCKALRQTIEVSPTRLFILLDGLDEYEGQKVELVTLINSLGSQHVRFCLASRADPPFPDAFHRIPNLEMHKLNTPGIKAFAAQTLQNFFSRTEHHDYMALQNIANNIAQRSRGVFLWARFAIFELINGFTRGETLDSAALRQRLEQVPQELQDIYSRIFRRGSQRDRETAGLVLLLISQAQGDLAVEALREAIDLLPRNLVPFQKSILSSFDKRTMTANVFKKAVLAATGGTTEIYNLYQSHHFDLEGASLLLRLSHRTVKSYLDLRGWQELLGDTFSPGLGHDLWLQICVKTLLQKRPKVKQRYRGGGAPILDGSHFQDYALRYLAVHAMHFEQESRKSSPPVLSCVLSTDFVDAHQKACEGRECEWCCIGLPWTLVRKPIHLAIAHGWLRYVEDYLSMKDRDTQRTSDVRRVAVLCACKEDSQEGFTRAAECDNILTLVLKQYPLAEDDDVIVALIEGSSVTLQTLLQYRSPGKMRLKRSRSFSGSRPRHIGKREEQYGPLFFVGRRASPDAETEAIIDLLLERGEDISDLCGPLGTVLHSHIQEVGHIYNPRFAELLVEKGLDVNRSGPNGNALEYLWQLANADGEKWEESEEVTLQSAICHLIDLGIVSRRSDPNGLVPTVDEMRSFAFGGGGAKTHHDKRATGKEERRAFERERQAWRKECSRYYLEGPLDNAPG